MSDRTERAAKAHHIEAFADEIARGDVARAIRAECRAAGAPEWLERDLIDALPLAGEGLRQAAALLRAAARHPSNGERSG